MAVENYHLKWDSHLTYLNSSVATLYKNEKFADVVLYSSCSNGCNNSSTNGILDNSIPTVGISAHKFILSSCSQFFATMFDNVPISSPNGVLYVVLPPELSHRAIQILVQYIYTGEATVSNDILNEVLRGGEILKIRGLCRNSSQRELPNSVLTNNSCGSSSLYYGTNGTRSTHNAAPPPGALSSVMTHNATQLPATGLPTDICSENKCSAHVNNRCPARYNVEQIPNSHSSLHNQIRGLGASVMPKDSPVIVKSPKLSQMTFLPSSRENKQHHNVGITVNKEVAIDPDDKCCYQSNGPVALSLHQQSAVPLIDNCNSCSDSNCKKCMASVSSETEKHHRRQRHQSQNEELSQRIPINDPLERDYVSRSIQENRCDRSKIHLGFSRRSRGENERGSGYFGADNFDRTQQTHADIISTGKTQKHFSCNPTEDLSTVTTTASNTRILSPSNCVSIKQEPVDWTTTQTSIENAENRPHQAPLGSLHHLTTNTRSPKQSLDFEITEGRANVKVELPSSHSADEDEMPTSHAVAQNNDSYSRLICDVCQKSFDEPKKWVKHLETHTVITVAPMALSKTNNTETSYVDNSEVDSLSKSSMPKKRRRASQQENRMVDHVTLLCDLCNTSFDTPAEWVRHMNNQHTEIELAMFNSKRDKEQKT